MYPCLSWTAFIVSRIDQARPPWRKRASHRCVSSTAATGAPLSFLNRGSSIAVSMELHLKCSQLRRPGFPGGALFWNRQGGSGLPSRWRQCFRRPAPRPHFCPNRAGLLPFPVFPETRKQFPLHVLRNCFRQAQVFGTASGKACWRWTDGFPTIGLPRRPGAFPSFRIGPVCSQRWFRDRRQGCRSIGLK